MAIGGDVPEACRNTRGGLGIAIVCSGAKRVRVNPAATKGMTDGEAGFSSDGVSLCACSWHSVGLCRSISAQSAIGSPALSSIGVLGTGIRFGQA